MNTVSLVHTLVWVIPLVGASILLRTDAPQAVNSTPLLYLGRYSAEQDQGFQRFQAALNKIPAKERARLRLEFLSAEMGEPAQLEAAARRAAARRQGIIVAPTSAAAIVVRQQAPDVPMIFASYLNPMRHGIVSDLHRRVEPVVGVWIADHLDAKRLEILHDAYPAARRIAVIGDRIWAEEVQADRQLPRRARELGLDLTVLYADNLEEAERLLATPEAQDFDAWCLPRSGLALQGATEIVTRMRRWKKPLIVASTADVERGAAMAYAIDTSFAWHAMAGLAVRLAAGESPGSIPIQQPQRFVLTVNARQDTGFPPPSISVVRRADKVLR